MYQPAEPSMGGPAIEDTHGHILAGDSEQEWEYPMRRVMQEIIPNIFLGPYACAMKKELGMLQASGITHIICVRQEEEARFVKPNFPQHFDYLVINISDDSSENIIQHFPEVATYLDRATAVGGKILMHGNAGISRSGALLIAYIMQRHSLGYSEALRLVQLRRFCVSPNEGFQAQLMEYEPIYRAQQMALQMQAAGGGGQARGKRGFMEEDDDEEERNPVNFPVHHPASPLPGHGAYVRSPAVGAGHADAGSSMEQ